jgi:autotransporter translocation and assembly factor TamB
MMRRLARWTGSIVAALILAIAALAVVAETDWFKERLRRMAVARADEVLNGQLTIGQLTGSLLRGVEFKQVAFQQPGGPVISVETVSVRYDPRILARGHFVFDELVLHRPVVHIAERADGWNVAHLVKPVAGGATKAIQFRRLTVVDGQATFEPQGGHARRFADVGAGMQLSYADEGFKISVDTLTGRDADTGLVIRRATGTFEGLTDRLIAKVAADTSAGAFSADVTGQPSPDGRSLAAHVITNRLDLAPILENESFRTDLTGRASVQFVLPDAAQAASTISFQVDASAITAAGYDARQVRAMGSYADGVLHVDGTASAYGAWASMKGEWRTDASKRSPNTLALSGRFRDLDVRQVPKALAAPPLASRLGGTYDVVYGPADWAVRVQLSRSTVEGATIGAGSTARVEAHRGVPHYEARAQIENLDLQRLARPLSLPTLDQARFKGRISGAVHVDGSGRGIDDYVLTGEATLTDSALGPTRIPSAALTVNLASRRLTVGFNGPFEHLTNEELTLGDKVPLDLSGTADVNLVFQDLRAPITLSSTDASGQVTLSKSTIAGYDLDQATLDASIAAGLVTVRELRGEGFAVKAEASGTMALDAEGDSNLRFTLDASSLEPVGRQVGRPIAGSARVEGTITGRQDHVVVKGSLSSRELKYGTSVDALALNGTFDLSVTDQQWSDFTAHADTQSTFLTVGGFDVQRMTTAATYHADALDVETTVEEKDRALQVSGRLLLHPDHQEVHLRKLVLSTADLTWSLPDGHEATIRYSPAQLDVSDLMLVRRDEKISVDGAFPLGTALPPDRAAVDLRIENAQLADVNRILLGKQQLTGLVNGTAHITGALDSPIVAARFTVTNGSVQGTTFDALAADAGYRDRRITLTATLDQQPGARLTAKGYVPISLGGASPLSGDEPVDLQIESTPINLGVFQAMTTHVTALKGTGQFNVHVTGTPEAPRLDGSADIADAGFKIEPTGMTYLGANARLLFAGSKLGIDHFVLRDEDGHTLTAEGGVEVANNRDVQAIDLHVVSDDIHLLKNEFGEIGLDADLKVDGQLQSLRITGQASVDRGRLEVDKLIDRFTKNAYSAEPQGDAAENAGARENAAAPAGAGSFFDNATVDMKLDMPDNFILRARSLRFGEGSAGLGSTNITVGGTVDVQKRRHGGVILVGDVQAVRGFYDFQGKRFDLVRGSGVRFRGLQPIDPALNVSAEREISGVTAQVNLNGSAREPSIRLSSTPPLDEGDILSLIVFGQPMNQLGESQRIDLAQRAGSIALGAIASPLAESVGRALNLDVFEIRTEGVAGGTVSLGSQVGSRLFIGLRQEFGRDDVSIVSFEYRVSELLRLVTSVAQGAQQTHRTRRNDTTGADLIFMIRY